MKQAALPAAALLAALSGCASVVPLDAALPTGEPAQVELEGTPFFPQEQRQCGPAALATVLTASGVPVSPDELTGAVFLPGREGSLQPELLGAARRLGRLPYVLPQSPAALIAELAAGRPVLVLQNLGVDAYPVWHYAVLVGYDVDRGTVTLRSGRQRELAMSWERFLGSWERGGRWAVTTLEPGTLPAAAEPLAYLEACAGLEAAGQLEAADAAYAAAIARWPDSPLAQLGFGNVAYARGDLAAAVAAYRRGAGVAPGNAILRNNLAQALLDAGCAQEAESEARWAVELARGSSLELAAGETLLAATRALEQPLPGSGCAVATGAGPQ